MAKKKTQIQRAIEELVEKQAAVRTRADAEVAVLQGAIAVLIAQRDRAPKRRSKVVVEAAPREMAAVSR